MNPLVSPAWVAERLDDPRMVLLDATLPPVGVLPKVDTQALYFEKHLPGALFFDIEAVSDKNTTLPHMLPTAERFSHDVSQLGVDDSSTLVIYEQGDVFSAPRAWWMFRTFGAKEVYLLDGGLQAWMAAGLPTDSGEVRRAPAQFHAQLDAEAVRDLAQVLQMMKSGGQLMDARSAGRFAGTAPEPRPGLQSGHMPGAVSVPYTELTRGTRMKAPEELRAAFEAKGVRTQQPVTTTCGSGVTAAVLALGLEICGAPHVSLYDGSWAEYAQQPDAVIEGAA